MVVNEYTYLFVLFGMFLYKREKHTRTHTIINTACCKEWIEKERKKESIEWKIIIF